MKRKFYYTGKYFEGWVMNYLEPGYRRDFKAVQIFTGKERPVEHHNNPFIILPLSCLNLPKKTDKQLLDSLTEDYKLSREDERVDQELIETLAETYNIKGQPLLLNAFVEVYNQIRG